MNSVNKGEKMAICDLHVHSVYSDGTCSVNEILNIAKQTGISAIALTDHNTVDGVKEILTKSKDFGVEAIGGVEISSLYNGKELHIVALFIKEERRF